MNRKCRILNGMRDVSGAVWIRHGKARRRAARQGQAWLGTAGRGAARHGKARCGAAWQGQFNEKEMTMKEYAITIQGKTPLLCCRFTDEAQQSATSGARATIANDATAPREIAEKALYLGEDGAVGIPGPNLFRCLIDAGKFLKQGRGKVTTQKTSLVPAAVMLHEVFIPLVSEGDWKVDTRPVRIPATGGRILRHRPCFDDWSLSFGVTLDESIIAPKMFRDLVDIAGSHIGLGDFRPDTKGPFGRFVVTAWREE